MSFFTDDTQNNEIVDVVDPSVPFVPEVSFGQHVSAELKRITSSELRNSDDVNFEKAVRERNDAVKEREGRDIDEVLGDFGYNKSFFGPAGGADRFGIVKDQGTLDAFSLALERYKASIEGDDEFRSKLITGDALKTRSIEIGKRDVADATRVLQNSDHGIFASLIGGFAGFSTDPLFVATQIIAPEIAFAKLAAAGRALTFSGRVGTRAGVEAIAGGAFEAATQPFVRDNKLELGLEHTKEDMARNVFYGFLFGGIFGSSWELGAGAFRKLGTGEWTPAQVSRKLAQEYPKLPPEEKALADIADQVMDHEFGNPNPPTEKGRAKHNLETAKAERYIDNSVTKPDDGELEITQRAIKQTEELKQRLDDVELMREEFVREHGLDDVLPEETPNEPSMIDVGIREFADNFDPGDTFNSSFLRQMGIDPEGVDQFIQRAIREGLLRDNEAGKLVVRKKPDLEQAQAAALEAQKAARRAAALSKPEQTASQITGPLKNVATRILPDDVDVRIVDDIASEIEKATGAQLQRSTIITGTPKASDLELEILRKVSDAQPIESPAFKRWSGGAPYITAKETFKHDFKTGKSFVAELFHGSPSKIDTLVAKGGKSRAIREPAVFLTNNEGIAHLYSNPTRGIEGLGDNPDATVFRLFAKMNNPLVHEPKGFLKPLEIGQSFFSKEISERLNVAKGNLLKKIDLTPEEQKTFNAVTKTAKDYEKFRDNVEFYGENWREHLDPNDFEYTALDLYEAKFSKNPDLLNELDEIAFNNEFGLSEIFKEAKKRGHDGIVFKNMFDEPGGRQDQFIVFNERQLKSFDNRGTFDPNDPNILKQVGDDGIQGAALPEEKLILIARDAVNPKGTLRHESLEMLNSLGFFKEVEWKTLNEAAVKNNWIAKHNIEQRYQGEFKGQPDDIQANMRREAIAEEFSLWRGGKSEVDGFAAKVFEKIKKALDAIARAIKGQTDTFEDIFKRIDDGDIALRGERIQKFDVGDTEQNLVTPRELIEQVDNDMAMAENIALCARLA